MAHIDEGELARVMEVLPEVLAREEMAVQRCLPRLSPADALDAALKRSLAQLHFELSQESFEQLRWKVATTRSEHQRVRARAHLAQETAAASAPQSRAIPEMPASTPRTFQSRTYTCEHGITWTASALHTLTPADPRHASCLVFTCEEAVLCVWEYPEHWRDLTDAELDALRSGH